MNVRTLRTTEPIQPIIKSTLDTDQYKINMGSVVFHHFPNARVKYRFFNRGNTKFPDGFAEELKRQVKMMGELVVTREEEDFLNTIPYLRRTYVEWFSGYFYDPKEVKITQNGGDLSVEIEGYWYRTIHWEVALMALISELYFRMTGQPWDDDWTTRVAEKARKLMDAGCYWIDFGTRRRFSFFVQSYLVKWMRTYRGFLGTSNPYLAMKYGVTPHGTFAHECIMAMSALYGPVMANHEWQRLWSEHFNGDVGVALTDTFTTDVFLRDFEKYEARLYDGVRHDSGDPFEWGNKMLAHYKKLGIDPSNKRLVFSDALNTDKYIRIHRTFNGLAQPVAGIGTHFTNDVGAKPLNMVIKLVEADFGNGYVPVVKLSDDEGKHTGDPREVELVKNTLRIQ